jgi:hypothetical protein
MHLIGFDCNRAVEADFKMGPIQWLLLDFR